MENAKQAAAAMKIGWNLGNAMDCCGLGNVRRTHATVSEYESQWGNPPADRELIHTLKTLGYDAIRIPVTWFEHLDEKDNIDPSWLERTADLADMVLAEDLYCIINVHHDTGAGPQAWLRADEKQYRLWLPRFVCIWRQIAGRFYSYGEKLLLEGFNEMLDMQSSWDVTDEKGYEAINRYYQIFVDTVRRTGGNNRERNLILNTYGASPMEPAARHFRLPQDEAEGHLMAEVHFYKPDAFSAGSMEYFGKEAEKEVDAFFRCMKKYFLDRQIPVILGECGTHDIRREEERAKYAQYVIRQARTNHMPYFWWDDGDHMKLIDRKEKTVIYPQLQKTITLSARQNTEQTAQALGRIC